MPISRAIGIVAAIVNSPHGLAVSALTTTRLNTARMMIMMASAPHRREQDDEVLHRAGDDDTGEYPQRAGKIAHLRREHRTDQRPRPGNGGEVMAKEHPLVGRHIVHAVVVAHSGRRTRIVES